MHTHSRTIWKVVVRRRVGVVGTSRSVSMSVFYVSSEAYLGWLKNMKTGEAQKKKKKKKRKIQCNNAYGKNRSNLGDGSEFGKFA